MKASKMSLEIKLAITWKKRNPKRNQEIQQNQNFRHNNKAIHKEFKTAKTTKNLKTMTGRACREGEILFLSQLTNLF